MTVRELSPAPSRNTARRTPGGTGATAPAPGGRGRRAARGARRHIPGRVPFWLAVPSLAGLAVFFVYPFVYLLGLTFTESSLGRPLQKWTGFANVTTAWQSLGFTGSLVRSVVFAVGAALLQVVLGTGLAVLLRVRGPKLGLAGTLLLLPLVTPPVAVGVAWKLLLDPVGGAFAGLWHAIGVVSPNPLGGSTSSFVTLVLIDTWQWTPLVTLLVFVALLGVDEDLLEAAALDGANAWRTFRSIVWSAILPTVLATLLLTLVIAFKVFDLVAVVTSGGPGFSTSLAPWEIFQTGLSQNFDIGTAAAMTVLFGIVVGVVTTIVTVAHAAAVRADR